MSKYRICWHSGSCTIARGGYHYEGSDGLTEARETIAETCYAWIEDEHGNRVAKMVDE